MSAKQPAVKKTTLKIITPKRAYFIGDERNIDPVEPWPELGDPVG